MPGRTMDLYKGLESARNGISGKTDLSLYFKIHSKDNGNDLN